MTWMKQWSRRRGSWVRASGLALALLFAPLHAHDPYTSWTDACLREKSLELNFTLSRVSALSLLANSTPLPPITPENFDHYAPKLKAIAADLFAITVASKPLALSSANPNISGDSDVVFHLAYAMPSKPAGKLRIVASYLRHVVDGHVGTLVVSNADGKDIGWSPVSLDQPMLEVELPGKPAESPKSK